MKDDLKINMFTTLSYRSEPNRQIERFHFTLAEIMRCLKEEGTSRDFVELLERSVNEYNHSIHTTTNRKLVDVFFGRTIDISPQDYETTTLSNVARKQENDLIYHNKNKKPVKEYVPGQLVYKDQQEIRYKVELRSF